MAFTSYFDTGTVTVESCSDIITFSADISNAGIIPGSMVWVRGVFVPLAISKILTENTAKLSKVLTYGFTGAEFVVSKIGYTDILASKLISIYGMLSDSLSVDGNDKILKLSRSSGSAYIMIGDRFRIGSDQDASDSGTIMIDILREDGVWSSVAQIYLDGTVADGQNVLAGKVLLNTILETGVGKIKVTATDKLTVNNHTVTTNA